MSYTKTDLSTLLTEANIDYGNVDKMLVDILLPEIAKMQGALESAGGSSAAVSTLYSESGEIALTDDIAMLISQEGALAMTLAAGTEGKTLKISCFAAGNDAVVTPSAFGNGTSLTFDADGEYAELLFTNDVWICLFTTATVNA